MLMLPPSVKVFLATAPTDMRRSFDGLFAMTQQVLRGDPLSGALFVFTNRRADRVKILFWEKSGLAIYYKRLEKGVFHFPESDGQCVEVEATELALLLEGIELRGAKRHKRYDREAARR